jgi:hypothetical protein
MVGSSHKTTAPADGQQQQEQEEEEEVLFVGVIDTLVPFKMKKKAEFMAKSLIQKGFSVVPP